MCLAPGASLVQLRRFDTPDLKGAQRPPLDQLEGAA